MPKLQTSEEFCPFCEANLQGEPIPKVDQPLYGATHFSRKIGRYDMFSDRVEHWDCPDCTGTWPREEGLL